jgi:hypothetical protein
MALREHFAQDARLAATNVASIDTDIAGRTRITRIAAATGVH